VILFGVSGNIRSVSSIFRSSSVSAIGVGGLERDSRRLEQAWTRRRSVSVVVDGKVDGCGFGTVVVTGLFGLRYACGA
jgi:hypothetical protein